MTIYLFDMDGTLTPARLPVEPAFAQFFLTWQQSHKSFLVSGSDIKKIEEQLTTDIIDSFAGIYSSMGNVLMAQGQILYKRDFEPTNELIEKLEYYRHNTKYPFPLYPNYIEKRIGMINFSVLGRDCPYSAREEYAAWDNNERERQKIATELIATFPQYDISIGGNISIDITPKGFGKEQVAQHLREQYPNKKIIFFGDKTFIGGNDYELAEALRFFKNTQIVQVASPAEVQKIISGL